MLGVGQPLECGCHRGAVGPRRDEFGWYINLSRSVVELDANLDFVADLDAQIGTRRLAQSDQVLPTHSGESQPGRPTPDGDAERSALSAADGLNLFLSEHERGPRRPRWPVRPSVLRSSFLTLRMPSLRLEADIRRTAPHRRERDGPPLGRTIGRRERNRASENGGSWWRRSSSSARSS